MNENFIQILVQSGTIGTNLVMLYVFYKIAVMFNNTTNVNSDKLNNSIEQEGKSKIELAKSLTKLAEKIEHCPRNGKISNHA